MTEIKYRFLEVNKKGEPIRKLPSRTLPTGVLHKGMEVLRHDGNCYTITRMVYDMEIFGKEEVHIELLKVEG